MPEDIWQAIYDHYLPVNIDDALPRTRQRRGGLARRQDRHAGRILPDRREADRLEGSVRAAPRRAGGRADPAQSRQALREDRHRQADRHRAPAHAQPSDAATQQLKADLLAFFAERVRTLLEASAYGFAYDEIAAAMEAGWASSLTDLVDRIAAVKAMRNEPNFLSILDSAKRIANITAGQQTAASVDPSKLENDVERRLAELAAMVGAQIEEMIAERDYRRALETFAAMAPELETFFEEVMVMVEDERCGETGCRCCTRSAAP